MKCDLCNTNDMPAADYNTHINGKRHKARALAETELEHKEVAPHINQRQRQRQPRGLVLKDYIGAIICM